MLNGVHEPPILLPLSIILAPFKNCTRDHYSISSHQFISHNRDPSHSERGGKFLTKLYREIEPLASYIWNITPGATY